MAEAAREGKQPAQDLRYLPPERKRAEGGSENAKYARPQLEAVEKLEAENGLGRQAVGPEQEHHVGRGQVGVDVLHTEQSREDQAAGEEARFVPGQNQGGNQDPVHAAVVLEVDVVNNQKPRRQEDGDGSGLGGLSGDAMG